MRRLAGLRGLTRSGLTTGSTLCVGLALTLGLTAHLRVAGGANGACAETEDNREQSKA